VIAQRDDGATGQRLVRHALRGAGESASAREAPAAPVPRGPGQAVGTMGSTPKARCFRSGVVPRMGGSADTPRAQAHFFYDRNRRQRHGRLRRWNCDQHIRDDLLGSPPTGLAVGLTAGQACETVARHPGRYDRSSGRFAPSSAPSLRRSGSGSPARLHPRRRLGSSNIRPEARGSAT
jgi:hypothetical protein